MSNKLQSISRKSFDFAQRKLALAEKYEAKLMFPMFGGLWKAGPELLNTLQHLDDEGVIIDSYNNPVKVKKHELYFHAKQRWQEQLNAWEAELQSLL